MTPFFGSKLIFGGLTYGLAARMWVICWIGSSLPSMAAATDFIITIGGGYEPAANQASLEANVLFFDQVLLTQPRGNRNQATYFADGKDAEADVQYLIDADPANNVASIQAGNETDNQPVSQLLERLYAGGDENRLAYRNHRVEPISGANVPEVIHAGLQHMTRKMKTGDRLIVYVTAHGGEAEGRNPYNTTISCWDEQAITARQFENWLDDVPNTVPVVLVMAQCYCGGFAHTIFDDALRQRGLSPQIRVGFFAQQHDLPAAGCRPDIENDEEYSSFFWGAFVGHSRNGKPLESADFNHDGRISFAEAHALAMLTSETIDLPLRGSEALLRVTSRIGGGYDHRRDGVEMEASDSGDNPFVDHVDDSLDLSSLASMVGTLDELTAGVAEEYRQTVSGLARQLEIRLDSQVSSVFEQFEQQRELYAELERTARRGRRSGSGRRQLRQELACQWPELSSESWRSSDLLRDANQSELFEQISKLPSYARYETNHRQRLVKEAAKEAAELHEVKFQRLIDTLEAILLARNLSLVASSEVVERYQQMLLVEQGGLAAADG